MSLLEIAPDEFRRLAAEVTEIAADYLSSLDLRPVFPKTSGEETRHLFQGSLPGGGSLANLMGLAMAREAKAPANEHGLAGKCVLYASEEVHMSIPKSVALLGLGRENLRLVPAGRDFRLIPAKLEKAIQADKASGKTPMAVVASAGTVNTG